MKTRMQDKKHRELTIKTKGEKLKWGRKASSGWNATKIKEWNKSEKKIKGGKKRNEYKDVRKKIETKKTSWLYTWRVTDKTSIRNKCAEHRTQSDKRLCSYPISKTRIRTRGQLMSQKINIGSSFPLMTIQAIVSHLLRTLTMKRNGRSNSNKWVVYFKARIDDILVVAHKS